MRGFHAGALALFAALLPAGAGAADVVADFGGQNPNGPWSYWYSANGISLVRMNLWSYNPGEDSTSPPLGVEFWSQAPVPATNFPALTRVLGTKPFLDPGYPDVLHVPSDLLLDPAGTLNGAVACWTAATAGSDRFAGLFEVSDTKAHGVATRVFHNVTEITKTVFPTTGGNLKPTVPVNAQKLTPGSKESFAFSLAVAAGDMVCFGVYPNDGNGAYTATGLRLTVTPVT